MKRDVFSIWWIIWRLHFNREQEDLLILKNSISPESALNNIGTPKWPDIIHWLCAVVGDMRN